MDKDNLKTSSHKINYWKDILSALLKVMFRGPIIKKIQRNSILFNLVEAAKENTFSGFRKKNEKTARFNSRENFFPQCKMIWPVYSVM